MGRVRTLLFAAALCVALGESTFPEDAPSEAARFSATFPDKLEPLAQWCSDQQLMLQRGRLAQALLIFTPDHEKARAWLRYKRRLDGGWDRPPGWKPSPDENPGAAPEWEKRKKELLDLGRTEVDGLVGDERAPFRERMLRALVCIAPDDAEIRALHGEVRVGSKWLLKESADSKKERPRIKALAKKAMDGAKLDPPKPAPAGWPGAATSKWCEILSVIDQADATSIARACEAARALLESVFEAPVDGAGKTHFRVFKDEAGYRAFIDGWSDLTPADRESAEKFAGWTAPDGTRVLYDADPAARIDAATRYMFDVVRVRGLRFHRLPPCLAEGVPMYFTYALLGTHATVHVKESRYSEQARSDIDDWYGDWIVAARRMLDAGRPLKVGVLMETSLNSMTPEDSVWSYALAAYLVETRRDSLQPLFEGLMRAGTRAQDVFVRDVGLDYEALEYRFARWLDETR